MKAAFSLRVWSTGSSLVSYAGDSWFNSNPRYQEFMGDSSTVEHRPYKP